MQQKLPDVKFFVQTATKASPPKSGVGLKTDGRAKKRPRRESNPDLKIRSLLFCPLNYEGNGGIIIGSGKIDVIALQKGVRWFLKSQGMNEKTGSDSVNLPNFVPVIGRQI